MSREPGLSVSILDSLHCSYVFTYVSHSGDCELLEDRGVVLSQTGACRVGGWSGRGQEGCWIRGSVMEWQECGL